MKKLRALLRLVRSELGEDVRRRENECFRDAGRELSSLRDATVLIETLDELAERDPERVPPDVYGGLRQALEARSRGDGAGAAEGAKRAAIATLESARGRVEDWPLERDGFAALAPGLERVYAQGRRRMRAAERGPSAENLHEWRKRVKDHWYHLTLLHCAWPELLEPAGDAAHDLSELLGDDHDLAVLAEAAHEHAGALGGAAELDAFGDAVAARRVELERDAFGLGGRVFAERPGALARRIGHLWQAAEGAPAPVA
jgi:CHAD domain-containing protein